MKKNTYEHARENERKLCGIISTLLKKKFFQKKKKKKKRDNLGDAEKEQKQKKEKKMGKRLQTLHERDSIFTNVQIRSMFNPCIVTT